MYRVYSNTSEPPLIFSSEECNEEYKEFIHTLQYSGDIYPRLDYLIHIFQSTNIYIALNDHYLKETIDCIRKNYYHKFAHADMYIYSECIEIFAKIFADYRLDKIKGILRV